jgi:hypothetical protein
MSGRVGYINGQLLRDHQLEECWREAVQFVFAPILIVPDPQVREKYVVADFLNDKLLADFANLAQRPVLSNLNAGLGLLGPPTSTLPPSHEAGGKP